MSDFRFANPQWAHCIWLILALVALLIWLDRRKGSVLRRFLSTPMQLRLVDRLSTTRRILSIALIGCALTAWVIALMRPQWGLTFHQTPRVGSQLMVCLDVSKSMLAEDTAPNRLERAKAELTDLLSFLEGDQVGLIAFAGRASVLCPLTPDFGFFRLILDEAGPHSVGRGGTRLEEPIRKALAGFRTESDVSRAILLITDGEDHDSFPLEAAKEAAERGIKIISMGFGDEAGSEIQVTDPRTGARVVLRDRDDKSVITRLDGETLREMARVTEGAYIPAGTGVLDLESIYKTHLSTLVRGQLDDRGHAVRRDAFQWAILAGLGFLLAGVVTGSGRGGESDVASPWLSPVAQKAAAVLLTLVLGASATAQSPIDPTLLPEDADVVAQDEPSDADDSEARDSSAKADEPSDPRELYNQALAYLKTDFAKADRLLSEARREAGTDGQVRFRSTYNMGWVEVQRADEMLETDPQQALKHLRLAADWFRDAVRLRPDHQDARHNLDVVLRRALELADSLAKKDGGDLEQRLDELIEQQRGLVNGSRQLVQQLAGIDDPNAADRFRGDFRAIAVQQRTILSDSQALAKEAREELDSLEAKKTEEQTSEEKVRIAQLSNLMFFANRAHQRMGQARSQMRRRQGQRAYRRASASLEELKRARDQLRNPVEVLGLIIADATTQLGFIGSLAASKNTLDTSGEESSAPAWLTREYLEESQAIISERTSELEARLQAGVSSEAAEKVEPQSDADLQERDSRAAKFFELIKESLPYITEGKEALTSAANSINADDLDTAARRHSEGIMALREARERFLDVRGLIELAHSDQSTIQSILQAPNQLASQHEEEIELPDDYLGQLVELAQQRQQKNIARGKRLAGMIAEELETLQTDTSASDRKKDDGQAAAPNNQSAQAAQAQKQRFDLANQLLTLAQQEMSSASAALTEFSDATNAIPEAPAAVRNDKDSLADGTKASASESTAKSTDDPSVQAARQHVQNALEHLQAMRRLFFSIVEHLRETAERQARLNDETAEAEALTEPEEIATKVGPLVPRQRELQSISQQIADALEQQAKQDPAPLEDQQQLDPQQQKQLEQAGMKFAQAAELVLDASEAMTEAANKLQPDDTPELKPARQQQDTALQKLAEAIALLVPPQEQQQQQQEQQQQQDQQQQEEQQKEEQQANADPSQLLQAVRDREARRRRDQEKRRQQQANYEPVDKDW